MTKIIQSSRCNSNLGENRVVKTINFIQFDRNSVHKWHGHYMGWIAMMSKN